jgi:hypothetical protein
VFLNHVFGDGQGWRRREEGERRRHPVLGPNMLRKQTPACFSTSHRNSSFVSRSLRTDLWYVQCTQNRCVVRCCLVDSSNHSPIEPEIWVLIQTRHFGLCCLAVIPLSDQVCALLGFFTIDNDPPNVASRSIFSLIRGFTGEMYAYRMNATTRGIFLRKRGRGRLEKACLRRVYKEPFLRSRLPSSSSYLHLYFASFISFLLFVYTPSHTYTLHILINTAMSSNTKVNEHMFSSNLLEDGNMLFSLLSSPPYSYLSSSILLYLISFVYTHPHLCTQCCWRGMFAFRPECFPSDHACLAPSFLQYSRTTSDYRAMLSSASLG